jgi:HlyD family secretion protein
VGGKKKAEPFMKKRILKIFGWMITLLIVSALAYTLRGRNRHVADEGERVVVKRGDVIVRATETGFLVPINAVEIKSEQAGEVQELVVQAGDLVQVGDRLAILRPESNQVKRVVEARAQVTQEQLNWEEAARTHERMAELFAKGFIARNEKEVAFKQEENARVRYELAKQQLLLTLGGNKALYEKYLKKNAVSEILAQFVILSPVVGTLIEVNVSEGEMVSSGMSTVTGGTTLMRISDLSRMWIKTKINEVSIGQVVAGQKASIRLDAIPGQVYAGTVVKISPKGEKVDNIVSYEVTLTIENPDQRLMPSMTANVDIITQVAEDVLYLPQNAVTQLHGNDVVQVPASLSSDKENPFKTVEVGLKNETVVVITRGLTEGEEVILPKPPEKKSE